MNCHDEEATCLVQREKLMAGTKKTSTKTKRGIPASSKSGKKKATDSGFSITTEMTQAEAESALKKAEAAMAEIEAALAHLSDQE